MVRSRDKGVARPDGPGATTRGRIGRTAGWLTESRGVAAAVAFVLGVGLQSADVIGRLVPDHRTNPSDLVSRVEITSADAALDLGSMTLLPYGAPLPAFPRSGDCSESTTQELAKTGHPVGLWLRLTLTNGSRGADASQLFVSNLRADQKRSEKPVAGVRLNCVPGGSGGAGVAYLAAMKLDRSNRATVADDAELEATGLEFAATVGLQPGESVQFDLHVTAEDSDYSFLLLADVFCGGCEQTAVRLGPPGRFRVYSAADAAPYVLSPAARTGRKQFFQVTPADDGADGGSAEEVDGEGADSPLKLAFNRVPRKADEPKIMRKLDSAFGTDG